MSPARPGFSGGAAAVAAGAEATTGGVRRALADAAARWAGPGGVCPGRRCAGCDRCPVFGPWIWRDYVRLSATLYGAINRIYNFSGDFQQSIQGIIINIGGGGGELELSGSSCRPSVLWRRRCCWYASFLAAPLSDSEKLRRDYAGLVLFVVLSCRI